MRGVGGRGAGAGGWEGGGIPPLCFLYPNTCTKAAHERKEEERGHVVYFACRSHVHRSRRPCPAGIITHTHKGKRPGPPRRRLLSSNQTGIVVLPHTHKGKRPGPPHCRGGGWGGGGGGGAGGAGGAGVAVQGTLLGRHVCLGGGGCRRRRVVVICIDIYVQRRRALALAQKEFTPSNQGGKGPTPGHHQPLLCVWVQYRGVLVDGDAQQRMTSWLVIPLRWDGSETPMDSSGREILLTSRRA